MSASSKSYSHEQFDKLINSTVETIRSLSSLKGAEYSGDVDRLANFRRNGEALGLPMETIWAVYAAKHWDAVMQYVKDIQSSRERTRLESISGRLDDLIVYAILFKAMIEERAPVPPSPNRDPREAMTMESLTLGQAIKNKVVF